MIDTPITKRREIRMTARALVAVNAGSCEVASLVHIPNARSLAMLDCLAQRSGVAWHPLIRGSGTATLGQNVYAGVARPVKIPLDLRLRKTYMLGTIGNGQERARRAIRRG